MKYLQTRCRALLLALVLALSLTAPALAAEPSASPAEPAAPTLDSAAQSAAKAALTYSAANSISWAVWEDGRITVSGSETAAQGTGEAPLPSSADLDQDLYGVGSVSKIYTTVAVMQLAERGRLSLDAPVTRYLPDFKMADPRYRQITVRMLLNHSSGLMGSTFTDAMLFDDADPAATDQLLERLATQRLKADPGAYSVYCNDGFTLAELVVEAVSGKDFMDYVQANILTPAGLDSTFAPGGSFDTGRLADTYFGADPCPLPQDCLNVVGAGGIYASAADLAAFGGALTGTKLLRQTSLAAMAAPEYARGIWPDDTLDLLSYGLGWDAVEWFPFRQNGITALVKGGDTLVYHAGLVVLPEHHMAAAVLSSGGVSTYNELAAAQMLAAALKAKGVELDESVPVIPQSAPAAMPGELMENAGYYGSTAAQYQVAVSADGVLSMRCLAYPSLPAQTFTYCADGTFRDASGAACVQFVKESNGETYLYQKAVGQLPELGVMPASNYAAVKLPENTVSQDVADFWADIYTLSVLPMNEKYTSQVYLAVASTGTEETPETVPGYFGAARIADKTSARYELQVPGTGGRDGQDITVSSRDGVTWLQANGALYMEEAGAPDLFTGDGRSYTTVQEDGCARWYHAAGAAGKTMTVQLPEDGGFWVYDADGQVTASSVLWGDTSAVLPEGGLLVFAGDPGARFHLSFQS
ncbi:serine hydrolase [uncultured Dysosmobacter sp.]|uniref:serine hydrolase domain-containing protein n=1 Tax=uncultured Dysosmobacter sp. TaxID=2591384 RepID=UPI00263A0E5B|nr:serine hydrolase domain-containing protein [uncultured Dysosmobacter sp.]